MMRKIIADFFVGFLGDLKKYRIVLIVLLLYLCVAYLFSFKVCPVCYVTGIPCPGCGITRAFLALLRGDMAEAWKRNAMIFLWIPFLICQGVFRYCFRDRCKKAAKILTCCVCLVSIVYYIGRMALYFPHAPMEFYRNNLLQKIWLEIAKRVW